MKFLNWIKGAKAKAIVVLGSFAMLLGVGASVYSVHAAKQHEVVETKAATYSGTVFYNGGSTRIWLWNSSTNFTGGDWGSRPSTTSQDYGSKYDYSATSSGHPTAVIFGDSGDRTFNYDRPFCTSSGSVSSCDGLIKFKSSKDSWTEHSMTWNSSTRNFTYTATDLPAGTEFGFQAYTYRTGFIGYGSDMGLSSHLEKSGSNYKAKDRGTYTFTLTAAAYGNYGDMTYGMTATFSATPTYTITYKYRSTDNGTIKSDTTSGAKYAGDSVTLPNTSASGYNFYGWWGSYSSGVFSDFVGNGDGSYTVPSSNKTLYGRYVANGYGYLLLSTNSWNPTSGYRFSDVNIPETGYRKITHTFAVNDEFYAFFCHSSGPGSDGNYHWSNVDDAGDAKGCFTASGDNIKCTIAGTYDILLNTGTGKLYIYHNAYKTTTGYYMAGTGTFGNWSIAAGTLMSDGTASGNTAVLENGLTGFPVSADSRFKVVNHASAGSNTWYSMTLGGTYSFAELYSEGDGNGYSVRIKTTGNYNFYFKISSGTNYMYIVDTAEITKAGLLYISSPVAIGNITLTTTNTKSESVFDDAALSSVTGADIVSSGFKFGGGFVYVVPIFDLRGADSGSPCTSVVFKWGGSDQISITGVDSLGGSSQKYYVVGNSPSVDRYQALKLTIDIEAAILDTDNESVCEVDEGVAATLAGTYNTLAATAANKTLLDGATINTYSNVSAFDSDGNGYMDMVDDGTTGDVSLPSIYAQLCARGGVTPAYAPAGFTIPKSSDDQSPLTLTLWIVLGAGILGMGAIGTAYFVSKKKKRYQA